ncbi:unnamed protein product [Rotaria socialis]|uniref:Poly [ADP-ribose] polymerase n=1 Tax=Rotaria socialis TaxID=392032 RepID=A0A817YS83_9BILA|nr:unnamed protein product [Rotaria socialis]
MKVKTLILDQHLEKLEIELATDAYIGTTEEKLALLPLLLLRAQIFCGCRSLCLPLFHSSVQILEQIQCHTIVSISTPTGSGKSTLVPALLAADGYNPIFVTQPRRLACSAISARVNKSMDNNIASWAVSGERSKTNSNTRITYFTDGLFKDILQFSEGKLLFEAACSPRGVVLFIDEVHERSTNIDLCLAFLALMLRNELHNKVKIILSSATIDPNIEKTFKEHDYHKLNIPKQKPLHSVITRRSLDENMFDLILRLNNDCKRNEQILCFVKSTGEVNRCVDLLKLKSPGLQAYKLIESQSEQEQQQIIAEQQIFFSTTVAQTSLTFPRLKYVIDTGLINVPIYDPKTDTTVLTEHYASKMTILQRVGRLARTCDGEYHAYYETVNDRPVFPKPQICQANLTDVEFSLRKSPFKDGLHSFKQYLPDAPEKEYLDSAVRRLQHLNILDHAGSFTSVGNAIAQLPDFGSVTMSTSVYYGLTKFNCGQDMIRLAACLSVMNNAGSLRMIPDIFKRSDEGDFMTLLSVMNHLKSHQNAIDHPEFLPIAHQFRRALARLKQFENFFKKASPQQRKASEISTDNWPNVARSLLAGYWEHVYVCMKELNGSEKQYCRYNVSDHNHTQQKQTAVIDYATTTDPKPSIRTVVLARDVFCGTDRRGWILSFVGIIQSTWLDNALERKFDVTRPEQEHFLANIRPTNEFKTIAQGVTNISISTNNIKLIGNAGEVLDTESFIRRELQRLHKWQLVEDNELNNNPTLQMNVRNIRKNLHYFHPLIWRFSNEKQIAVKLEKDDKNSITISVNSRDKDYEDIKDTFDMFVWWLRKCVAVRNEHSGVIPKFLKKRDTAIEQRIACVTDSERTLDKRMMAMRDGTRESRMEVVAWVAVCQFQCRLEGGFVRDWIVDHRSEHPTSIEPKNWVTFNKQTELPELTPKLIPADLDFHLPLKKYFDLERFLDEMHRYGFKVIEFQEPWRYILLFDQYTSTGPFTAEFIQPHVGITHDRIDFNVNNLYVECDYTKQLGQKIDLQVPPYSIDLDSTVADIRAHQLIMLRPEDAHMNERIKKMTARGYRLKERRFSYMPNPLENKNMVLTPVPAASNDYKMIKERFKKKLPHAIIELIEQVQNPNMQRLYEAQKTQIEQNHPRRGANEMLLYHGTKSDQVNSILENGFDDRYFKNDGLFGRGAYFADDPSKSHEFTDKEEVLKVVLLTKVLMGKMFEVDGNLEPSTIPMNSAQIGYDSTKGKAKTTQPEYVVYRSAQALPYYKITYIHP